MTNHDDLEREQLQGEAPPEEQTNQNTTSEEAPSEPPRGDESDLTILRDEIASLQTQLEEARAAVAEQESRALRAMAELDTVRRRSAADQARAKDAGLDAAVVPVMQVYDDLRRALFAAEQGDPASIVPGVRAVMEALDRSLDQLAIKRVGEVGDTFDPDLHEALTSAPLQEGATAGTIAEVFEAGYVCGERLIRPARVVVYQDA